MLLGNVPKVLAILPVVSHLFVKLDADLHNIENQLIISSRLLDYRTCECFTVHHLSCEVVWWDVPQEMYDDTIDL